MTPEGLAMISECLRVLVEHPWIQVGEAQVRVTVSAGAVMLCEGESFDAALDRADRLTDASKPAGRTW